MALFTFYLCRDDGTAPTFESHEAHSDAEARLQAQLVLAQHPTAAYANVWLAERKVGRVDRSELSMNATELSENDEASWQLNVGME
jgi:hypothetical protein